MGVFQNCCTVIKGVILRPCGFQEGMHMKRTPQHRYDIVDDMTPQIEHDPALETGQIMVIILCSAVGMVHICLDFKNTPQHPVFDSLDDKAYGGIGTEHIAHLKRKMLFFTDIQKFFITCQIFPAGFIHVHGDSFFRKHSCNRDKIQIWYFDQYTVRLFLIQRLIQRNKTLAFVGLKFIGTNETRRQSKFSVIHHADHLKGILHAFQGCEFSQSMFMRDTDLDYPEFLFHLDIFPYLFYHIPIQQYPQRRIPGSCKLCI